MRRRLAAAAAGAVLIAAAVLAFSLGKHPVVAGTNTAVPVFPAFSVGSGGTECQLVSRIPAKASHVRLVVTSLEGERPVLQVGLTDRRGPFAISEKKEAILGGIVLPLKERTRAAHPANLCISNRGDGEVVFAGEEKRLRRGDAPSEVRGGVASVAFLRPGTSSWAARRDLIAERYANSQAGALGGWSLWTAIAFAVIAFALALWWLVFRLEGGR
jgi:hypothetical protein